MVRGILYGLGVAVACSLVYGIITWTMGIDLSLIAIAVGYIVGRAVRKGSGGLGGRRCQIAAVGLTYFSIVTRMLWGFLGGLFFGALQHGTADLRLWPGAWSNIGSLIALWPIRTIQAGASGIIGLIIIFAGLTQAWRQTARDPRLLMGPYTLSDGSSPA